MEKLVFSIALKEVPVTLTDKDKVVKNYVLKELTGEQSAEYLDGMSKRIKFSKGEMESISSLKGLQSDLLVLCLRDSEDVAVPKKEIEGYPASVQTKLFNAAQELSGLTDAGTDAAKKE